MPSVLAEEQHSPIVAWRSLRLWLPLVFLTSCFVKSFSQMVQFLFSFELSARS